MFHCALLPRAHTLKLEIIFLAAATSAFHMRLALTRLLCRSTLCDLARRSYPVDKTQKVPAVDNM